MTMSGRFSGRDDRGGALARSLFARAAAALARAEESGSEVEREVAADLEALADAMLKDRVATWRPAPVATPEPRRSLAVPPEEEGLVLPPPQPRPTDAQLRRMAESAERRRQLGEASRRLASARLAARRLSLEAAASAAELRGDVDEAAALRREAQGIVPD